MSILNRWLEPARANDSGPGVLLIGTPSSIRQLRHMLRLTPRFGRVIGCVLLRPVHNGKALGAPVLGTVDRLADILDRHPADLALISLPAAMANATGRIRRQCTDLQITARSVSMIEDQLSGRHEQAPGPFDVSRLLDRPPHRLDHEAIAATLADRRVMITGAGGSIGSELARLVASYRPAMLTLMERTENSLFEIDRALQRSHPDVPRKALLHDVTHQQRTEALVGEYRPQVIFHAAAHKHVPMMEDHPRAAVENNFFGTRAIADAAVACGAEHFVMISTDKAVNPTSVMGATKRLAELYVQHLDQQHVDTALTMVRFGNVLGSACSVIPIWAQQLADGGPITVTDPRMTRYFMTIPEAAALVLQAASLPDCGGRVMVLDMGEPIRVLDLARRFITLHGLEPEQDVPITFIGARPGEKLYEELAYASEDIMPTAHEAVRMWRGGPPAPQWIARVVEQLEQMRYSDDQAKIIAALRQAVPEMQPAVFGGSRPAPEPASSTMPGRPPLSRSA